MKQINNNQSIGNNKKGKAMVRSNYYTQTNIICGIVTVKLNHNITANLPIELVCEILSFMFELEHQLKFQPMLQNIEDGTMCV